MFIQKRKRVPLQTLIRHFVSSPETGQMSVSTLKSHLSKLVKRREIGKLKDGKTSIYCVPGESLPERKPPSGVDLYLVDEMKKLVSDIVSSGLLWFDDETEIAQDDKGHKFVKENERSIGRHILCQRAFTLYVGLMHVRERRAYSLPLPRYFNSDIWETDDSFAWDLAGRADGVEPLTIWMQYYIEVIDYLSRELSKPNGTRGITKTRKATPRP